MTSLAAPFSVQPNMRCLRGLHFEYTIVAEQFDRERFLSALRDRFVGELVESEEQLGERVTRRLIRQFRFEVRMHPNGMLGLIHRACARAEHRDEDRQAFEAALTEGAIERR